MNRPRSTLLFYTNVRAYIASKLRLCSTWLDQAWLSRARLGLDSAWLWLGLTWLSLDLALALLDLAKL